MNKLSIPIQALLQAVAVTLYVSLVAFILQNAEHWFGKMESILGPVAFLMLFVLSAATVGLLVFGRAVYLYMDGQKQEAVKLLLYTIFLLLVITAAVLSIVASV